MNRKFLIHLRKTLIAGIVVLVPLVVTIKVLEILFVFADGILGRAVTQLLKRRIPGLGLILMLIVIYFAGVVMRTFFGKNFLRWAEEMIEKIPIARTIYSGVKQLLGPFGEDSKKVFGKPVLIEYPAPGIHTYAFLVNEHVPGQEQNHKVNVFIPTNHLHLGVVVLADRKSLIELDASFEDMIKLMASFGLAAPEIKPVARPGSKS